MVRVPMATGSQLCTLLHSLSWGKRCHLAGGRILKACPPSITLIAALESVKLAGPILQNESMEMVGFLQG